MSNRRFHFKKIGLLEFTPTYITAAKNPDKMCAANGMESLYKLHVQKQIIQYHILICGPGSSVGIATGYGLDCPGIESRWGEFSRTCPDWPWSPPSLLYNGYRVFLGGKERSGRDADPSPASIAVVKKELSYTSTPPMGRTACIESQCLYSRAIPLLPLWAVRPV